MTHQETDAFITEKLHGLTQHADWLHALTLSRTFHHYSFTNRLLIWAQLPSATRVAGFKTWHAVGRQVQKGAQGIRILAPLMKKLPDPNQPGETRSVIIGFRTVSVFDVSQTAGEPLVELTPPLLTTATHSTLLDALLQASPVSITFVPERDLHGANGSYHPLAHTIQLGRHLAPDQQLKTLLHELAHHYGVTAADQPVFPTRSWEECAAESTAYLLTGQIGRDTMAYSSAYVASWSYANPAIIHQLIDTVSRRMDAITQLLASLPLTVSTHTEAVA